MLDTFRAVMTASSSTSQKSAIFFFISALERAIRAAEQDVGLNADRSEVAHAVLRRLRFQFASRGDVGHERQVNVERVVASHFLPELADGFEKRLALDVADRAANFDEQHVDVLGGGFDAVLDFVRNMGNDLNRAAQVFAATFFLDD